MPTILGLDASSTTIGYCVLQDGRALVHGEIKLPAANIADRCCKAQEELILLLEAAAPDAIAIESPVARFGGAVIAQARVSGALLAMLSLREIAWVEIAPQQAKIALGGFGNASKAHMQACAEPYGVYGEHASDALGICLAAVGRVIAEEVAV